MKFRNICMTDDSPDQMKSRESERLVQARIMDSPQYERMLVNESKHPTKKIAFMIMISAGVLAARILCGNGRDANPLGISCGSLTFWTLQLFPIPYVLILTIISRRWLVADYHMKKKLKYEYKEGDVQWNERNTVI